MIEKDSFSKIDFNGAKGIVFIGEKMLVYRRDNKTDFFPLKVDLPGGGREKDESPFETFKREVGEEFGINLEKSDILYSKKYKSVMEPRKESYFFVTKSLNIKESNIVFGDEGLEFFLVSPDEFVNLTDGIKRAQDKVADYLKTIK